MPGFYCFKMIAIGRCLLLFISLAGTTLSVDRFSKEDIAQFLDYIFRLNNAVRHKHEAPPLTRTDVLDGIANQKMNEGLDRIYVGYKTYNIIHNTMHYDDTTKLDTAEAIKCFSLWYEQEKFYDYMWHLGDKDNVSAFTQIVWKRTSEIGLTFRCEENQYIVLAVYNPAGNVASRYTSNVRLPIYSWPAADPEIQGLIYQTEAEKFLDCIVELHNETRRNHGLPPLERDDKLDVFARKILVWDKINVDGSYGRNHIKIPCDENTTLDVEKANRIFSRWETVKFTLIVGQDTQKIGMGIQRRRGECKVLALYKLRGIELV